MNSEQTMDETNRYFQRYRETVKRLASIDAEFTERTRQWEMERDTFMRRKNELHQEIQTMRKVITKMVEEDMDPTMAKLQHDESWGSMATIWTKSSDPFDTYDTVIDLSDISVTGAIGAIGYTSVGTISTQDISFGNGPSYSGAGANGPAGPYSITTK